MLRFIPPFTVDIPDLDLAAERLQDSLQRLSRQPRVVFDLVGNSIRIRERLPVALQSVGMRLLQRLSS